MTSGGRAKPEQDSKPSESTESKSLEKVDQGKLVFGVGALCLIWDKIHEELVPKGVKMGMGQMAICCEPRLKSPFGL